MLCLQDASTYVPPKPALDQVQQWPVMVLEPMLWLLYALQAMIAMGEGRLQQQLACCLDAVLSVSRPPRFPADNHTRRWWPALQHTL